MKTTNKIWPQYVKNSKGKITQVFLPIKAYEEMQEELKEYEKVKKNKGISWVQTSKKKCNGKKT